MLRLIGRLKKAADGVKAHPEILKEILFALILINDDISGEKGHGG